MLMPILTVKAAAAPTAHAAAVVETVTPKDRMPILPPIRISGRQSEAMLKILETLNRHLVGSEPLPREALVRLLDTLAKVLKFPPLPQESLRDFSKRLAIFLETLPPAMRQALEKQLGQRNLAVSIRILTEALKLPSLLDAPRPERAFTLLTLGRPLLAQPEIRPATISSIQQQQTQQQSVQQQPGQGRPAGLQQGLPASQVFPHLASATFVPDSGILQAVLKKAFGDDDEPVTVSMIAAEEYETGQEAVSGVSHQDNAAKPGTPRSGDAARMPAKADADAIPLLRAAAAFLAADPEALSQVAAIADGVDSRVMTGLEEELGLDMPEPVALPEDADPPEQMPQRSHESESKPAPRAATETRTERTAEPIREKQVALFASEVAADRDATPPHSDPQPATLAIAKPLAQTATRLIQTPATMGNKDVAGFTSHDLGEWDLEPRSAAQPRLEVEEAQPNQFQPDDDEKVFFQTLKALVEASLPSPAGTIDWNASETLFAALAGETADMDAEILFADLEAADDSAAIPDTTLLTGDIADSSAFEADTMNSLLDTPDNANTARSTFSQASPMNEPAREAQFPRQPDIGIARDAIPFAMIPYLPAKAEELGLRKEEDEEQPTFAGHDEREHEHEHDDNRESSRDQENGSNAASTMIEEDATDETGDAYDLYRRMGGLG